jgi:hypothetical protein
VDDVSLIVPEGEFVCVIGLLVAAKFLLQTSRLTDRRLG